MEQKPRRTVKTATCAGLGLLLCALLSCQPALAQEQSSSGMHWAFSAFFGSGWYEISDSESVFIIRAPLSQTRSTSDFSGGRRTPGIELHYPLTFGLHNVDSIDDFTSVDNFGSVAFTPGIEVEIPLTEKWYLRPVVHVGWGTETHGGESAWIYYGGIKSRYTPGVGKLDWSLLNAVYRAGYNDDEGGSGSVTMAMAGVEFHHPLQSSWAGHDPLQLNWHLTYSWLFDPAEFSLRSGFDQTIDDQWELGFALAPHDRKFKLGFLAFEQLGLSFRTSSDGEYRAISINVSSPFH
jgi:hypothetical protein